MNFITISVTISVEDDNGLFGQEEHQLILSEDEQIIGVCFIYIGEPFKDDSLTYS